MADPALTLFSKHIAGLAGGQVDAVLTAELADLVQAVSAMQKKGTLTLKITVDPVGSSGHAVQMTVDHKTAPPRPQPDGSVLYVGDGGSLHRSDPYQQQLLQEDPK